MRPSIKNPIAFATKAMRQGLVILGNLYMPYYLLEFGRALQNRNITNYGFSPVKAVYRRGWLHILNGLLVGTVDACTIRSPASREIPEARSLRSRPRCNPN